VFQIFAQLIELRAAPLPAVYMSIFRPLLTPVFWERSGNVPALTRLVCAYLNKAGPDVIAVGHLQVRGAWRGCCGLPGTWVHLCMLQGLDARQYSHP
jgi:hypothetical protein